MANSARASTSQTFTIEDAVAAHRAGRLNEAAKAYQSLVEENPRHFDALHLLGVVRTAQGQSKDAVQLIKRALKLNPRSVDGHYNLGVALDAAEQQQSAITAYRQAIALNPQLAVAHNNLGVTLLKVKRYSDAIASLHKAIVLSDDYAEAHYNLGNVLIETGRHAEAVICFRKALALKPDYVAAYNNLGVALYTLRRHEEAIDILQRALQISSDVVDTHNTLGGTLLALSRYDEAAESYRSSIALNPTVKAYAGLGYALLRMGRGAESVASYRKAIELDPDNVVAHSDYIYALDFIPEPGFAEHQEERKRWYERHGRKFASAIKPHAHDRMLDRKLRIGYVSADFNSNSPSLCFGPVLSNHDRSKFDVVLYSEIRFESSNTNEFREMASLWRDTVNLSDKEMARQIRDDRIDILVDLSGHSFGNRLLVFAQKPAPVQVTAWGYATGTGVPAIDYLFSDPVSVPESARHHFAEKIYDLPCILGHVVPSYAPDVVPPPSTTGKPFTFGCLNRLNKITAGVLAVWSRLLRDVPHSRLLLKDAQLSDPKERQRIIADFAGYGIGEERLQLMPGTPHSEHLAAFGRVDIALDPFPTTGGISTLEAMWMGVPVVALLGNGIPSRVGGAIVSAAGLTDWVATSEDEYVEIAKRFAADPATLAKLRSSLRPSMAASPLGDSIQYCRAVEDAYRTMWQRWCQTAPAR